MVPYRYPRIIFRRQEEKSRAEPESVGELSNFFLLSGLLPERWMFRCFAVVFACIGCSGQSCPWQVSNRWRKAPACDWGWYQRDPQNCGWCELMESLRSLHYWFFLRSDEHLPNFIASSDAEFCMETSQVLDQICWFSVASMESKSH